MYIRFHRNRAASGSWHNWRVVSSSAIAKAQADLDAAMINAVPEALPEEVCKKFQVAWGEWQRNLQMMEIMDRSAAAEFYRFQAEHTRVSLARNEARESGDPLQQKYEKEFHDSASKPGWKAGGFFEMMANSASG
jgi:hypothetical protein